MQFRVPDNLGILLLAIWLIVTGAVPLLGLGSQGLAIIMSLLAIAAGVLLLIGRS